MSKIGTRTMKTDAVIDHYLRNPSTPPFMAKVLIQHFGISNPSPRFIEAVATAFKEGSYIPEVGGTDFGDGVYGNLEATVAAIMPAEEQIICGVAMPLFLEVKSMARECWDNIQVRLRKPIPHWMTEEG